MIPTLPPLRPFRQFCQHEDGWSDHYGALQTAAEYCGLSLPTRYFVKAIWSHGCFGPWEAATPGALIFNAPDARKQRIFVARQEEADFLQAHGHPRARALGLPIAYAQPSGLERVPRSLLVMPTHTLVGDQFPDRTPFERYADEIAAVAGQFAHITICIHPSCRKNGFWIKEFTDRGFSVIDGADASDQNALRRMRAMFEQYETVTSNGWGSHIAYALAFGARVAIHGTRPAWDVNNLKRDVSWAVDLASLEASLAPRVQAEEREFLREFLVPPDRAVANRAVGEWLVGMRHRLSPEQMREVLPELVDPVISDQAAAPAPPRLLFALAGAESDDNNRSLLVFLRWLRRETNVEFDLYLHRLGPLAKEFVKVATVFTPQTGAELKSRLSGYTAIHVDGFALTGVMEELGGVALPIVTRLVDFTPDEVDARTLAVGLRHSLAVLPWSTTAVTKLIAQIGPVPQLGPEQTPMVDFDGPAALGRDLELLRARLQFPADCRVVMASASDWAQGGADLWVQIAARACRSESRLRMVWVAPLKEARLHLLRSDLDRLGLTDVCRILEEPLTPALMGIADLWAVPSREEPLPLTAILAAGMGKPLVSFSHLAELAPFTSAGGGAAVAFLDLDGFATACVTYVRDDAARHAAGATAREVARTRYQPEALGPVYLETLLQAAGTTPERIPSLGEIYARWPEAARQGMPGVAAQIARATARREAAEFVRAGRRGDAVQRLIRAAKADIATNVPLIVIEGLVEIADDLSALEPKQAAFLLGEAKRLASGANCRVEDFRLSQLPPAEPSSPVLGALASALGSAVNGRAPAVASAARRALLRRLDDLPSPQPLPPYSVQSPVAMLVFNRPDHTQRVFAAVRAARPRELFLVADGPRADRPADEDLCAHVRAIVAQVDWPCQVRTAFAERNLGCTERVVSGLNWVFDQVEHCIILEDDCLPSPEFFRFCDEKLERHATDPRVSCITGNSFQFGLPRSSHGSFCTPHILIWGWATWRRAWRHYDRSMSRWPALRSTRFLDEIVGNGPAKAYWTRLFDAAHAGRTAWDLPWVFSCWAQKGLGICPAADLVENIGFDAQATGNIANVHPIFQRLFGNFPVGRMDTWTADEAPVQVNEAAFRFIQKVHYEQDWPQVRRDLAAQWLALAPEAVPSTLGRLGRDGVRRILESGLADLPLTEADGPLCRRCEAVLTTSEPSLTQLLAAALFAGLPRTALPPLATAA